MGLHQVDHPYHLMTHGHLLLHMDPKSEPHVGSLFYVEKG